MAEILLVAMGSGGDVYPFIGLGLGLQRRGHRAVLITNEHFEHTARDAGLDFAPMGNADDYAQAIRHPDIWHPWKSAPVFAGYLARVMRDGYARIKERHKPGETVVVAPRAALCAPFAHDCLGVPVVSLALNPIVLRSAYSPPKNPFLEIPRRIGPRSVALLYRAVDAINEKLLRDSINRFRLELGLSPLKRSIPWLRNSPQLTIGLWPDWLYGPQPDWPSNAVLTGFIHYEPASPTAGRLPDLNGLIGSEPPLVFTAGTAMAQGRDFYAAAAGACRILNRPGILLTQFPEQVPRDLPPTVKHVSYAPLGALLAKSAALVHHGGIGSAARALQAGIPQLLMPMAYGQFDLAERLSQLGVAKWLRRKRFTPQNVAGLLRELLASPRVAERCAYFAQQLRASDALDRTCALVEATVSSTQPR